MKTIFKSVIHNFQSKLPEIMISCSGSSPREGRSRGGRFGRRESSLINCYNTIVRFGVEMSDAYLEPPNAKALGLPKMSWPPNAPQFSLPPPSSIESIQLIGTKQLQIINSKSVRYCSVQKQRQRRIAFVFVSSSLVWKILSKILSHLISFDSKIGRNSV